MKIEVSFLEGQKLKANFGKFEVISDQAECVGGNEEFPEPMDYFMASMPLCAAFYIRTFCAKRDIPTDGISIVQNDSKDEENKFKRTFSIDVKLPEDFPEKYKKALVASANSCTVKKVIQNAPDFEINLV